MADCIEISDLNLFENEHHKEKTENPKETKKKITYIFIFQKEESGKIL